MIGFERLRREQEFHDRQARDRRASWQDRPQTLTFDDDWYLDHEPWIRPALDSLGDVRELPVLDLGCGHGMASVVLARRGARVTGVDLSREYLAEARARGRVNDVDIRWLQADAEHLPFAAGSFARIWGNAILHHLDPGRAAAEIRRVLTPGGWAVFCEPWGENPLLRWARQHAAYPGKSRTADEEPLRRRHLRELARVFPDLEARGFQAFGMAGKLWGKGRLQRTLDWCDRQLLAQLPGLRVLCRYVVVRLR
jgi:SAM-dependent methyltransferase